MGKTPAHTGCLATEHPEDCTAVLLLPLPVASCGHPLLLYVNSCRGKALKVSVEIEGKKQHAGSGCIVVTKH